MNSGGGLHKNLVLFSFDNSKNLSGFFFHFQYSISKKNELLQRCVRGWDFEKNSLQGEKRGSLKSVVVFFSFEALCIQSCFFSSIFVGFFFCFSEIDLSY